MTLKMTLKKVRMLKKVRLSFLTFCRKTSYKRDYKLHFSFFDLLEDFAISCSSPFSDLTSISLNEHPLFGLFASILLTLFLPGCYCQTIFLNQGFSTPALLMFWAGQFFLVGGCPLHFTCLAASLASAH